MSRQLTENTLIVASHNEGKVREIRELLNMFAITVKSAGELDLPEPDETEETYKGNAILKAKAAALASGMPALADDSGFELMAINKAPGLYSARWAGPNKDFGLPCRRSMKLLSRQGLTIPMPVLSVRFPLSGLMVMMKRLKVLLTAILSGRPAAQTVLVMILFLC